MPTYVDRERGLVSREIFVDEDVYQREQERIFCKQWLFIGHGSQIPNAGDYFASRMGEESVILVRGKDGQARVFLNSCRHRGMKVCRYDEGNAPVFTCPYHGWSYGLNGDLSACRASKKPTTANSTARSTVYRKPVSAIIAA